MDFGIGEKVRELICLSGHPSVKSQQQKVLNVLSKLKELNVDLMWVSHYPWTTRKLHDYCRFVLIDKNNPITGLNTPKEFDYICDNQKNVKSFINYNVLPSNALAHYLLWNLGTSIAKNFGYDVCYHMVHDIENSYSNKLFEDMRPYVLDYDVVSYPVSVELNRQEKHLLNSNLFSVNMKSSIVESFLTKYNNIEEWASLHNYWQPILKQQYQITSYPCVFNELLLTLETSLKSYSVKLMKHEMPVKSECGFVQSFLADEKQLKKYENDEEYEPLDVNKLRQELDVVRT